MMAAHNCKQRSQRRTTVTKHFIWQEQLSFVHLSAMGHAMDIVKPWSHVQPQPRCNSICGPGIHSCSV